MKILLIIAFLCLLFGWFLRAKEAQSETLPDIKTYSIHKVMDKWGGTQWSAFNDIVERESQWKPTAQNPKSTAYGIPQFLNSTWDDVGCVKTSDPYIQVDCMIVYIDQRYDTPSKALQHHKRKGWY